MADFEIAVDKTISNEGGDEYTETKEDKGGATKYGISLRFYKTIEGNESATNKDIMSLSMEDAKSIYKKYFWDPSKYGKIKSQTIAYKVFDMSVLIGAKKANKMLQESLNNIVKGSNLVVDGIIGEKTLNLINEKCNGYELSLLDFLINLFVEYFKSICEKDKSQLKFLSGWIARAKSC